MQKLFVRTFSLAVTIGAAAGTLQAQALWSASALTAAPHTDDEGVVKTRVVDGLHGRGVRLRSIMLNSTAQMYVPVTAPSGTVFRNIQLRAEDSTAAGYVKAELIAQPVKSGKQPVVLAQINTGVTAARGLQVTECPMPWVKLSSDYLYYVKLTIRSDMPSGATVYGVALTDPSVCGPDKPVQCGPCPEPIPN